MNYGIAGVIGGLIVFVATGIIIANRDAGERNAVESIRKQCERTGQFYANEWKGEVTFYCYREPKK